MGKMIVMATLAGALVSQNAWAEDAAPSADATGDEIVVTGANAGTKTDTPLIELPQPVTTMSSTRISISRRAPSTSAIR
jgi:iron complex outermembrane receptor protein